MSASRSFALLVFTVYLLVGADARAVNYTFAGKFTSSRGQIINIPMIGNTGCGGLTLMSGPNGMTIPQPYDLVPTMTRGVNTQPSGLPPMNGAAMGFDLGCVKHVAGKILKTTGTMAKVGGAFTFPTKAWFDPFPSMDPLLMSSPVPAISVKYATGIAQLATSFRVAGPNPETMLVAGRALVPPPDTWPPLGPEGGTMASPFNLAPWLKFDKLANIPASMRSGRVGATGMFTWCPDAPDCMNIMSAPQGTKAIIKYAGGGNAFGGTMSALVTAGAGVSSVAHAAGSTGPVEFQVLPYSGSQPTGRGYAQLAIDHAMGNVAYSMHNRKNVTKPQVGMQNRITMVSGVRVPLPDHTVFNYGFPFTTMTVLARITGTGLGNPMVTTFTAKGADVLTSMGGRNISLVAGGIGITNRQVLGTQTPEIASMLLTLPEPGAALQMAAGVLGLLAMAAWRARR